MSRPDDERDTDLAWQQIVDNYGERPALDEPAAALPPATDPDPDPASYGVGGDADEDPAADLDEVAEVDRFQPPVAPPVTLPSTWQRRVAWGGVFLAPVLGMLIGILRLQLPSVLGWALVAWFVGGFGYLVATMSRTPREPWDDGSRV